MGFHPLLESCSIELILGLEHDSKGGPTLSIPYPSPILIHTCLRASLLLPNYKKSAPSPERKFAEKTL